MLYNFHIFSGRHFVDLGLYQTGHEQCDPGHLFGPAVRGHFLFHYILKGKGTLMCPNSAGEDVYYQIGEGEGFLLLPGQVTTYFADVKDPWEYAWIEFDGLRAKEGLNLAGFSENSPIYQPSLPAYRDQMKEELLYITAHPGESPLHLIGHLYLFFDALIRSNRQVSPSDSGNLRDYYIHEAISYIERYYQKDISIEEIARTIGLNRSYFGKIFREATGKSPQSFLLSYRMSKAAELLQRTDQSVARIGNAVGYQNQLHFSRAFKNVYGVSPRAFRTGIEKKQK